MTSRTIHEPAVVWLTGLSGAGKSTIAQAVCERLAESKVKFEYLDGDVLRAVLPDVGFTRPERDAHVRRIGFLASRLEHHGIFVVCALISPSREARAFVRGLCRRFVEVHVSTPLAECERRDVKGLYRRARRGEIRNFTGIDDAYEAPEAPELRIDTSDVSVDEATERILMAVGFSTRMSGHLAGSWSAEARNDHGNWSATLSAPRRS